MSSEPTKFRKKPVVIEAFQMTRERRASNVDWPEWMHRAWNDMVLGCRDYPHSGVRDEPLARD